MGGLSGALMGLISASLTPKQEIPEAQALCRQQPIGLVNHDAALREFETPDEGKPTGLAQLELNVPATAGVAAHPHSYCPKSGRVPADPLMRRTERSEMRSVEFWGNRHGSLSWLRRHGRTGR